MGRRPSTDPKPKKSFSDIFAKYKTYNVEVEGFGGAPEWVGSFYTRIGFEEAEAIIAHQEETPFSILGEGPKSTWEEVKKSYRSKAMQCHPDRCSINGMSAVVAEEKFKKLQAAYTVLEKRMGR